MPTCGFCRGPDVSKEHLWAGWLGKIILESRAQGGMKTFQTQIERGGKTIAFPNRDLELTVGMPCESCNNGWMSDLENEVKPFMTDMVFRGEKTILDAGRQRSLIRWLVKTAMVNEFTGADSEHKYFTADERKALKDSFELPSNLWIWLARYDGVLPLHSLQLRGPKSPDIAPRIYSLTFGSNFLVAQLFAFREGEGNLGHLARVTKTERLIQLYPQPARRLL